MSSQTATINIRIDRTTKERAKSVFKKLGLEMTSTIKQFLDHVMKTRSVPFKARTVNGFTPEYERMILDEWKAMKAGNEITYKSAKEFLADMNS